MAELSFLAIEGLGEDEQTLVAACAPEPGSMRRLGRKAAATMATRAHLCTSGLILLVGVADTLVTYEAEGETQGVIRSPSAASIGTPRRSACTRPPRR